MKQRIIGLFIAVLLGTAATAAADVIIDIEHFPDQNFRMLVAEKADRNSDNVLSDEEAAQVETIDCPAKGISDLTGIELFPSLKALDCSNGKGNTANGNVLSTLDFSGNPELTTLVCYGVGLESLNLGTNTRLAYLDCHNNGLIYLDVSGSEGLQTLYCFDNDLSALLLGEKGQLARLDCSGNGRLAELDVTGCSSLSMLDCGGNNLHRLDIRQNERLEYLDCSRNQLQALTPVNNPELTDLDCSSNHLTALDLTGNRRLERLSCDQNYLLSLDLTSNPNLRWVNCAHNHHQMSLLTLGEKQYLKELDCCDNRLAELDISQSPGLQALYCGSNLLSALNLTGCIDLRKLNCSNNQLLALNLGMNEKLEECLCFNNRLTELNTLRNPNLGVLQVHGNYITELDISNQVQRWPDTRGVRRIKTREGYHSFARNGAKMSDSLMIDPYVTVTLSIPDYFGLSLFNAELAETKDYHRVTVTVDGGNGTACAIPGVAKKGQDIVLEADPAENYILAGWQVLSGGVSVQGNRFVLGSRDVEIRAVMIPEDDKK